MYTTGSWARTTQPTHLENIIRQNHQPTGSCAITFLPLDWDPHHPTTITTIRIAECEQLGIDEAYGADLLAVAIAFDLSKHRGLHEQVHTTSRSRSQTKPSLTYTP